MKEYTAKEQRNMNPVEVEMDFPAEHGGNVFGQFDAYMKKIEQTLHVSLILRDGRLKCIGQQKAVQQAVSVIEEMGTVRYRVGNVLSSDVFYNDNPDTRDLWQKMGVLAVEMESAALYMNAARCGKNALTICTISDSLVTGEATTSEERQTSFNDMLKIALETA